MIKKGAMLVFVFSLILVSFIFSLGSVNAIDCTAVLTCKEDGNLWSTTVCSFSGSNCDTDKGRKGDCWDNNELADSCASGCYQSGYWAYCNSGGTPSTCAKSCLSSSTTACGESLVNGCKTNCDNTGGRLCSSGQTCVNSGGWKCLSLNETVWLNLAGSNISSADSGDTVLMGFGGQNVTNQSVFYSVNKKISTSAWWNPFSWNTFAWNSTMRVMGKVIQPLSLNNVSSGDLVQFNATIVGINSSRVSNNLSITSVSNAMPAAVLISPTNNTIFANFTLVNFTQASTDEDDLLNITWSFGDGSSLVSYSNYSNYLNSTSADTSHMFNLPGQYIVQLTAKEMTRSQSSSASVKIIILGPGINVVPVITSPLNGESVGAGVVWFNISQSYIVNCTICSGSCTGSRSGGFYTSDNKLNCSYAGLFPGSKTVSPGRVLVNWSMGDGTYRLGNWSSDYNSSVVFGHPYFVSGIRTAIARLNYYA